MRDKSASTDCMLSKDPAKGSNLSKGMSDSRDSALSGERSTSREDVLSRESSKDNILTSRESLISSRESLSSSGGYTRYRDTREGPGPASVVRTESHLARFNTARAMFEKMSSADKEDKPERRGSGSTTPTDTNKIQRFGLSHSASVDVNSKVQSSTRKVATLTPIKQQQSNGHVESHSKQMQHPFHKTPVGYVKSMPNLASPINQSVSSKSYESSFNTSVSSSASPPSSLTYSGSQTSEKSYSGANVDSASTANASFNDTNTRVDDSKNFSSFGDTNTRADDALREDQLTSPVSPQHQQHKELIQRHKNWFQSYSKSKSSSPGVAR